MSTTFDYNELLARAREEIPQDLRASDVRWEVPEPELAEEGSQTVLRNFNQIVQALRRDSSHFSAFLMKEIGTAARVDGERMLFKGKLGKRQFQGKIDSYVDAYVLCHECHKPDTVIEKDIQTRTNLLKCQACGARRPLR